MQGDLPILLSCFGTGEQGSRFLLNLPMEQRASLEVREGCEQPRGRQEAAVTEQELE